MKKQGDEYLFISNLKLSDIVSASAPDPAGIINKSILAPENVLSAAKKYVKERYDQSCGSSGCSTIVDGVPQSVGIPPVYDNWSIDGITLAHSYKELEGQKLNEFKQPIFPNWQSIEVYELDYRIRTTTPERIFLAGDPSIDKDGWISSTPTYLIFVMNNDYPHYLFPMVINDSAPGATGFTHDLKNMLVKAKAAHDEAFDKLRTIFSDGESMFWYENEKKTAPEGLSFVIRDKSRCEVHFYNYNWLEAQSYEEPEGASLCLGDSTEAYFRFYLGSSLVVWSDGDSKTIWKAVGSDGLSLPDCMMLDYSGYEIKVTNITIPVIDKESAEETLSRFMDAYGTIIKNVTPQNIYRVLDFKVLSYKILQTKDSRVLYGVRFAVKPPEELYQSTFRWAGNSVDGEGDLKGWIVMGREMVLEKADGVWRCTGFGTGGYSLD